MQSEAVYLRGGTGLPSIEAQQAELRAAGRGDALAYMDEQPKPKRRPEDDPLPELTRAILSRRAGDRLWVSHLCLFGVTENDACGRLARLAGKEVTLCVASTGEEYRLVPEVAEGLALAERIGAELARWRTAPGRETVRSKRALARSEQSAAWKRLREMWPIEAGFTLAQIEAETRIPRRTAYNAVKRGELPERGVAAAPRGGKRRRAKP